MMFWGMMFAGVVSAIENTLAPKILELTFCIPTFKPMKHRSIDFEALGVILPNVRPWAVMLLVVAGVGVGWKWPSSSSVV
jgi:hypothetical protein